MTDQEIDGIVSRFAAAQTNDEAIAVYDSVPLEAVDTMSEAQMDRLQEAIVAVRQRFCTCDNCLKRKRLH